MVVLACSSVGAELPPVRIVGRLYMTIASSFASLEAKVRCAASGCIPST